MYLSTDYMDRAISELAEIIEEAREALEDVDFDTFVGTGFSGGIVIPSLALALDKNFVLIRKETDDSHHGSGKLVGILPENARWIFVDDFVSSGRTKRRVFDKIGAVAMAHDLTAKYVGDYLYQHREEAWKPFSFGGLSGYDVPESYAEQVAVYAAADPYQAVRTYAASTGMKVR